MKFYDNKELVIPVIMLIFLCNVLLNRVTVIRRSIHVDFKSIYWKSVIRMIL